MLYLHIPFCKKACHYCNFHFSTSMKYKTEMVEAICKEIELRKDYLDNKVLETVYFGGGTPSVLEVEEIEQIFETITKYFTIKEGAEITLEANPDDLTIEKLKALKQTPINRLSIGIQSFVEEDLVWMNRAHNANEAYDCIKNAKKMGFENLTIDLIYGTPTLSNALWQKNLETIFELDIPHLSCYCLTVEPNTALDHFVQKGKKQAVNEEQAAQQFEYLMEVVKAKGYEHYEISNFAKPPYYAQHNTNYWRGKKYLGVGPAAHSFNGESRQWNIANNAKYIKAIQAKVPAFEIEYLNKNEQYNEYILTALRTMWGVDNDKLKGLNQLEYFKKMAIPYLENGTMLPTKEGFHLTNKGRLLADNIISELMRVE